MGRPSRRVGGSLDRDDTQSAVDELGEADFGEQTSFERAERRHTRLSRPSQCAASLSQVKVAEASEHRL